MAVLLLANGHFQRYRLLSDLKYFAYLVRGDLHFLGDFLVGGISAQLLEQLPGNTQYLVYSLNHMYGNAYRPCLIRYRTGYSLTYPPGGISRKLVTLAVVELFDGLHQTEVALLYEVEKEHTAVDIPFGNADNQSEVRLDKLFLCLDVSVSHTFGKFQLLFG